MGCIEHSLAGGDKSLNCFLEGYLTKEIFEIILLKIPTDKIVLLQKLLSETLVQDSAHCVGRKIPPKTHNCLKTLLSWERRYFCTTD